MKKFLMWLLIGIAVVLTVVAFLIPESVNIIAPKQPEKKKPATDKIPDAEVVEPEADKEDHAV